MKDRIANHFQLEQRNTNVKTELLAGITTFLAMAYILSVNPGMLSATGMSEGAVFTATAIVAIVGTLIMGLVANYPVALAPGMGLNAFFAFTMVLGTFGYSWQLALSAVFVSGVIFLIISMTSARENIINAIPSDLKYAIGAGIGLFIAFLGFQNAGIIVSDEATVAALGSVTNPGFILAVIGLAVTAILYIRKVPAAVFFGLVITAVIGYIWHAIGSATGMSPDALAALPEFPALRDIVSLPDAPHFGAFIDGFGHGEWGSFEFIIGFVIVIFTLIFMDFFDTAGTLVSVGSEAGMVDEEGNLKDSKKAFAADSIATIVGSTLGTSTATTFVESLSGVAVGGRTGLTAVFTALGFTVALLFSNVFTSVTAAVTAPALIFVGILMAKQFSKIAWDKMEVAIPAFLTIIIIPLAYSISEGIAVGFIFYPITMLAAGRRKEVSKIMYGLGIVFLLYFITKGLY